MRDTIWNKRIPTLLGIMLIVIGIGLTSLLVKTGVIVVGRASPSQIPNDVRISNISDTAFTVSYTTEEAAIGSLNFGKDRNLGITVLDDRDREGGNVISHKVHHMSLKNLTSEIPYFFSITSGQKTYLKNDTLFDVTTGPVVQSPPSAQVPLTGRILMPDGSAPKETIIYVTSDNTQVISTLVKKDGSYTLPLNSMREDDLSSYFTFDKNTLIKLLAVNGSLKSDVTLYASQTSPVPTITLGNDYDFTIATDPIVSQSTVSLGFPSLSISSPSSSLGTQDPQIITPKDNQTFTDAKPQFKGTATPNEKVEIIVRSPEDIQAEVTADANGNWSFRPENPLSPGEHTISITARDKYGILKTIKQSFIVFASGTKVTESATPSATLTPSPAPTLTPTPTPTPILIPSPLPMVIVSPMPTPTLMPTALQSQTKGGLPAPGPSNVVIIGMISIGIILASSILFVLTRGRASSL